MLWVIAGLGNPGRKYTGTRHNIGFRVVDAVSERLGLQFTEKRSYHIGEGLYEDVKIILVKPLTFMNLSGTAIREVLKRNGCPPDNLIVVHDDLDLPVGRVKIRPMGSSGGHNGVQSVIDNLGTDDFSRIKVGIGRPVNVPGEVYVLGRFHPDEKDDIEEAVVRASDAVFSIIDNGVEDSMNKYNR